jgi:SAM-dependent methyltransferase
MRSRARRPPGARIRPVLSYGPRRIARALRSRAGRLRYRLLGHRYDPATELVVKRGPQSLVNTRVFGVYDLAKQEVVPKQGAGAERPFQLDTLVMRARGLTEPPELELDRYSLALALLPNGSGICLDACTASPEERVCEAVEARGYRYVPIDIDGDGERVLHEDLTRLSFESDSVAAILSLDTLEHIVDFERALGELRRVLRPSGVAIVHVPCYYFDRETSEPIVEEDGDPWAHVRYFSAWDLVRTAAGVDFAVLRISLHLDYGAVMCVLSKLATAPSDSATYSTSSSVSSG